MNFKDHIFNTIFVLWLHFFERQSGGSTIGIWIMFAKHIKILAGKTHNINTKIFLVTFKKSYY